MFHLKIGISLWGGILLCWNVGLAQQKYNIEVRAYTTEQGLPSNHVYQCFQDRRGLLWLLTGNGLCRFDGQQFRLVLDKGFNTDYSKNKIAFEEPNGDLWLSNYVHKDSISYTIINTITGKISTPSQKKDYAFPRNLLDVEYAGAQSYWATTSTGEVLFLRPGQAAQRICYQPGGAPGIYAADSVHQTVFLDITDGTTRDQVCRLVNSQGEIIATHTISYIQHVFLDRDGRYRFYTLGELGWITPDGKMSQEPIEQFIRNHRIQMELDYALPLGYDVDDQRYWMIATNKLQVFDQKNNLLSLSGNDAILPGSAFSIFIDRQHLAWICTIEGLFKVNLKQQRFQRLLWVAPRKGENQVLMSCRGILKDEQSGLLYANSGNCFWAIDGAQIRQVFCRVSAIYGMAKQANQALALGCEEVFQYFPAQNRVHNLGKIDRHLSIAWSFLPQKTRTWVGLNNGLAYLDSTGEKLSFVKPELGHPALDNAIIHSILPADQQQLWLLTEKGLFLFHPQKGIKARYWTGGKGKYKLPVENLRTCYQEKKNRWWLATAEGLLRWNPETGESRLYTTEDGLSNNNIYAAYPDAYGFLWMSSDKGIIQFQKSTGKTRFFLPEDGITHREFNRTSHFQAQNGQIYFGSLNGITSFHPKDFYRDFHRRPNVPIILTRAHLFSRRDNVLQNAEPDYLQLGKIVFKPRHLYLTLRFALLDYAAPKFVQYEYRIEGLSTHWAPCPAGVLQLAGLPYGHYQLQVRAKTGNGLYAQQILKIPILVKRPFYVQYWFLFMILAVISGAIVTFFRYRNQWLKQRKEELEKEVALQTEKIRHDKEIIEAQAVQLIKLDEAKTRFFANVTHELRTPLTLILGPLKTYIEQNQLQADQAEFLYLAKHHTTRLQQMVDDLLDLSKLEAGKLMIQESSIGLQHKIKYLLSSFETLAQDKGIKLLLVYEASPDLVLNLDRRLFRMILTNLLSNALKFTAAGGQISLKVQESPDEIQIEVADTGRGIHPDDLPHVFERYFQTHHQETAYEGGTGIGLALARESSKAMGGSLDVKSVWGEGSTFIWRFPKKEVSHSGKNSLNLQEIESVSSPITIVHQASTQPNYGLAGKANILLVEDNPDLRQYLLHVLSREYDVLALENGLEAREYLEKNTVPDLIISDIMMPLMDGFQLLEWLKSGDLAHLPVIMLTARSDMGDKLKALQIGVDDYLVKPFVEEELLTRIQNLLKRQELRRSLATSPATEEAVSDTEQVETGSGKEEWLRLLEQVVLEQLENPDFSVNDLAKAVFMSRSVFYSEMGRVLGLTPNEYINEIRLLKALELFQASPGIYSVKEMASRVGYRDEKYFSRQFKQRFGVLPSQLR